MKKSLIAIGLMALGVSPMSIANVVGTGDVNVNGTFTVSTCEVSVVDPAHTFNVDNLTVGSANGRLVSSYSVPFKFIACPSAKFTLALNSAEGVVAGNDTDGALNEASGKNHLKFQVSTNNFLRAKLLDAGQAIIPNDTPLVLNNSSYNFNVDTNSQESGFDMNVKIYTTGLAEPVTLGALSGSFTYTFTYI